MYAETKYEPKDYMLLDHMSKDEVIDLLESLERNWLPSRPLDYYEHTVLNEQEYSLLKYCKAIDLATKWLRNEEQKEEKSLHKDLIKQLRHYAKLYRSDQSLGRVIEHTEDIMDEAASVIEVLAKKRKQKDTIL